MPTEQFVCSTPSSCCQSFAFKFLVCFRQFHSGGENSAVSEESLSRRFVDSESNVTSWACFYLVCSSTNGNVCCRGNTSRLRRVWGEKNLRDDTGLYFGLQCVGWAAESFHYRWRDAQDSWANIEGLFRVKSFIWCIFLSCAGDERCNMRTRVSSVCHHQKSLNDSNWKRLFLFLHTGWLQSIISVGLFYWM